MEPEFRIVLTTLLLRFSLADANSNSNKTEKFALYPENENNQSDVLAENFSECTKTKRFQECIGSIQTSIIFCAAVVFVLTLFCTLICCKVCFDRRERKRKRRQDTLCQVTGYTVVPNFDAPQNDFPEELLDLEHNNNEVLHSEDPDPPPVYPGLEDNEDDPPPYSPSFRRTTVLDSDDAL